MTEEKNLSPQPENGIQPKSLDLMRGMRWCSHLLYHRYNLNFSRNKILYLIYRRGPMTQKALAAGTVPMLWLLEGSWYTFSSLMGQMVQ